MNQLPTDEGLIFILCDDIREEIGGKLSLIGMYSDVIVIEQPATEKNFRLPSVGIFLSFRDGMGQFQMSIELTTPDKKSFFSGSQIQSVEKLPDGWMNIIFKLAPFNGNIGDYKLKVTLSNNQGQKKEYLRLFKVKNNN